MDGEDLGSSFTSSPLGAVYATLIASLDGWSGNVAPGTSGALTRAIDQLRMSGDQARVERLQHISVTILRLQQAAASGDGVGQCAARQDLRRSARSWLEEAPMFPSWAHSALELQAA